MKLFTLSTLVALWAQAQAKPAPAPSSFSTITSTAYPITVTATSPAYGYAVTSYSGFWSDLSIWTTYHNSYGTATAGSISYSIPSCIAVVATASGAFPTQAYGNSTSSFAARENATPIAVAVTPTAYQYTTDHPQVTQTIYATAYGVPGTYSLYSSSLLLTTTAGATGFPYCGGSGIGYTDAGVVSAATTTSANAATTSATSDSTSLGQKDDTRTGAALKVNLPSGFASALVAAFGISLLSY